MLEKLIKTLEFIELDYSSMRSQTLETIVERVKEVATPYSEENWNQVTPVGTWRFHKLIFETTALVIEQIGSEGLYSTYFTYSKLE